MEFLLIDRIRIAVFCKAELIRLLHKYKGYQITKGTQRLLLTLVPQFRDLRIRGRFAHKRAHESRTHG